MSSETLTNIIMVLTGLTIAGFALYWAYITGKIGNKASEPQFRSNGQMIDNKNLVDKSKLQDMLEIEEIDDNNIIHLKKGNGLRVIFSISTPDIYLLNDDEQHVFENALLNLALSLNFPIQFLTTTRKIETKKSSEKLLDVINSNDEMINDNLKDYAELLYTQLVSIEQNRKVNEIKNYCIIGISNIYDPKRAESELKARIETVVKGFTNAKIKTDTLEKEKVLQLLSDMLNRGDNIPLQAFYNNQSFSSLYTSGMNNFNASGGGYNA